jgi:sugar-specific transcriptional regulator TrmB
MEINPEIKPLLANLFRLRFINYLLSESFELHLLEYNAEDIWESHLRNHRSMYSSNYDDYQDAFKEMASEIYNYNKERFYNFIFSIIIDFASWSKDKLDFNRVIENLNRIKMPTASIEKLKNKLEALNKENATAEESISETQVSITNYGIIVAGKQYDALRLIHKIFNIANRTIKLIDGYINEETLDILSDKKKGVEVSILTKSKSSKPILNAFIEKFNSQHGGLEIRFSDYFHDRFVIIDDIEFYHIGASVKDLGNKTFMYSKIEDDFLKKDLLNQFKVEWDKSLVQPTPEL